MDVGLEEVYGNFVGVLKLIERFNYWGKKLLDDEDYFRLREFLITQIDNLEELFGKLIREERTKNILLEMLEADIFSDGIIEGYKEEFLEENIGNEDFEEVFEKVSSSESVESNFYDVLDEYLDPFVGELARGGRKWKLFDFMGDIVKWYDKSYKSLNGAENKIDFTKRFSIATGELHNIVKDISPINETLKDKIYDLFELSYENWLMVADPSDFEDVG